MGLIAVPLCAASLGVQPGSVNAETPGLVNHIAEWQWRWDDQTIVESFEVPRTYFDRRRGWRFERGSTELRYQLRIPEDRDRIRGIMVLVPGLDQHSGRYRHFVERFREEFILASCDARFMGQSNPQLAGLEPGQEPPPDAYRELRAIRKFYYLVYDLDEFLQEILPRQLSQEGMDFEEMPLILVGHSLGGLVALDYILGNDFNLPPTTLAGVILSAPALRPPRGMPSPFQRMLVGYSYSVNASFGSHTEERTILLVSYEQLRNIIMTPIFYLFSLTRMPVGSEWVTEWVTDDPWEQIGFQTDPNTLRANPLNFIYQVQEHMLEIRDREQNMVYPYLLFYSPADQIVDPAGAIEFASRTHTNHPLNQVVAVPDTHSHELFRARRAVRDRLLDVSEEWVDQLLPKETPE
jgi:alpha-beta hydrolase superfamily lysophospholipase